MRAPGLLPPRVKLSGELCVLLAMHCAISELVFAQESAVISVRLGRKLTWLKAPPFKADSWKWGKKTTRSRKINSFPKD